MKTGILQTSFSPTKGTRRNHLLAAGYSSGKQRIRVQIQSSDSGGPAVLHQAMQACCLGDPRCAIDSLVLEKSSPPAAPANYKGKVERKFQAFRDTAVFSFTLLSLSSSVLPSPFSLFVFLLLWLLATCSASKSRSVSALSVPVSCTAHGLGTGNPLAPRALPRKWLGAAAQPRRERGGPLDLGI